MFISPQKIILTLPSPFSHSFFQNSIHAVKGSTENPRNSEESNNERGRVNDALISGSRPRTSGFIIHILSPPLDAPSFRLSVISHDFPLSPLSVILRKIVSTWRSWKSFSLSTYKYVFPLYIYPWFHHRVFSCRSRVILDCGSKNKIALWNAFNGSQRLARIDTIAEGGWKRPICTNSLFLDDSISLFFFFFFSSLFFREIWKRRRYSSRFLRDAIKLYSFFSFLCLARFTRFSLECLPFDGQVCNKKMKIFIREIREIRAWYYFRDIWNTWDEYNCTHLAWVLIDSFGLVDRK